MPPLHVRAEVRPGEVVIFTFDRAFRIGRLADCDVRVESTYVSRIHAEGLFENGHWIIRDLGSANGLFVNGSGVDVVQVDKETKIQLGVAGPILTCTPEHPQSNIGPSKGDEVELAHYVRRYFSKLVDDEPIGERTMHIRQAFAHVEGRRRKKTRIIVAVLSAVLLAAGMIAWHEHRELVEQRHTAEDLFYAIKSQDIDLANLDRALSSNQDPAASAEMNRFRARRKETQQDYDRYLATLNIYSRHLTEQQKVILRVTRIFGECEIDLPPGVESQIESYIARWRASGRLKAAIETAGQQGYTNTIARDFLARGLPPQFFYLALQESNFNPYAVGPSTRKGYAKGMWQFIPETAVRYNLHLGPLVDQRRPDPADERHNYEKETTAAVLYIQDLYRTDAQASGFLVMACYNWGEDQVLPRIKRLPANPKERNFWRLLAKDKGYIPQETYDYVFSIVSAAVIGENPRLFGFDFDNPLAKFEDGAVAF